MDAFGLLLEPFECLPSLELSPEGDRLPEQPALFREPVLFDHALDSCVPAAGVGVIDRNHAKYR
jgi:hypothetical protein